MVKKEDDQRKKDKMIIDGMKRCSKRKNCVNPLKDSNNFVSTLEFKLSPCSKDGFRYQCNACACLQNKLWRKNNKEKDKKSKAVYRNNNKDKKRNWEFKKRYGITLEDYNQMLDTQNGVCAICGKPPKKNRLAVDHNHITGKVRGLLCATCNKVLGLFLSDYLGSERFKSATRYIEKVHI